MAFAAATATTNQYHPSSLTALSLPLNLNGNKYRGRWLGIWESHVVEEMAPTGRSRNCAHKSRRDTGVALSNGIPFKLRKLPWVHKEHFKLMLISVEVLG